MATGCLFTKAGGRGAYTDLDDIFEPIGAFSKIPDVGIYVAGVDISNRYAPVAEGSPAAATNMVSGGTDIANLFAAAGSVQYIDGPYFDLTPGQEYVWNCYFSTTLLWNGVEVYVDAENENYGPTIDAGGYRYHIGAPHQFGDHEISREAL